MEHEFNDRLGHRSRRHVNLLFVGGNAPVIVEFVGESIPRIVSVLRTDFDQDGKWSHHTWKVALAENVLPGVLVQDWGTGKIFNDNTWDGCIAHLLRAFSDEESFLQNGSHREAAKRFILAHFPKAAERITAEAAKFEQAPRFVS